MKNIFLILLTSLSIISCSNDANIQKADINIIPKPQSVELTGGEFILDSHTSFFADGEATDANSLLMEIIKFIPKDLKSDNTVKFVTDKSLAKEEYSIEISDNEILIKASTSQGFIWAVRSIQQMLPVDFKGINQNNSLSIPNLIIKDKPAFSWRGSMLDAARHFMPVDKVKEFISLLSYHKMNVFHWHLTEDQGWRIEIKKYPKLTEIGSWRKDGKGGKYGGYYTQEQIKEVVQYASERGITVVPEIEFPGHSVAALSAYPELSCTGGPFQVQTNWGVFEDIYCAGNDEVFTFAENVLTEVMELFPSKYIHIGGDEAPKARWEKCEKCQARMKAEGLNNEHDLQSYFISRLEKFLNSHNRKLIGWDEIQEGGLAPEATMQVWRDVAYGKKAIEENHDIISSPTSHCYLDYTQKQISVEKIYSFNPIPDGITGEATKHVLGGEGNLWTERIPPSRLYYMAFPRLTALSEALWTNKESKDYKDFYKRLQKQYLTYDKWNVNYGPEGDVMDIETSVTENGGFKVKVTSKAEGVNFKYSFSEEPNKLIDYTAPIEFKKSTTVTIQAFRKGKKYGESKDYIFNDHIGRKAKLKLISTPDKKYSGNVNSAIDGLLGSDNFRDGKWQGIYGKDYDAVLTFDQNVEISKVTLRAYSGVSSWIFLPRNVEVYISKDGNKFTKAGTYTNTEDYQGAVTGPRNMTVSFDKTKVKAIKVKAKKYGIIPEWHGGKGSESYMFVDEIILE